MIRDTVYEDDLIIEDTFDWYAQDTEGNVWYFGEIVINYEYDDEGNFIGVNHDGEWSADDPGNQPGWPMKATPGVRPGLLSRIRARHRRGREHHRRDRAERRHALRALRRRDQDHRQLRPLHRHRVQILRPGRRRDHRARRGAGRQHQDVVDLYRNGEVGVPDPRRHGRRRA